MNKLPATGFLRLTDVLGEDEITKQEAEANRAYNASARAEAIRIGRVDENGDPIFARRPTTPRRAKPAIIPVSKTTWWTGVKSGRYPQPSKALGPRITVWRVEDIIALLSAPTRTA